MDDPYDRALQTARDHIPSPLPQGWSAPVSYLDRRHWEIQLDDDIMLWVAVETVRDRECLDVLMIPGEDRRLPITNDRVEAILRCFLRIEAWVELRCADAPRWTRGWRGVGRHPRDRDKKRPPSLPVVVTPLSKDKPRPPLLDHLRHHLPEELPEFWSVPMATDDPDGAWLFCADLVWVTMSYVTRERTKLQVAIKFPPRLPAHEYHTAQTLSQLVGVTEFVPAATEEPQTRTYLGTISDEEPWASGAKAAAARAVN